MHIFQYCVFTLLVFTFKSQEAFAAKAVLLGQNGKGPRVGIVTLKESDGCVIIKGNVTTLSPGLHGFHIHEKNDMSKGCDSLGGHYNPFNKQHGAPDAQNRHVGDLGNIRANEQGLALINIRDNQVKLRDAYSVVGRSIVVHEGEDDMGLGSFPDSKTTGHAGKRHSCGIIVE